MPLVVFRAVCCARVVGATQAAAVGVVGHCGVGWTARLAGYRSSGRPRYRAPAENSGPRGSASIGRDRECCRLMFALAPGRIHLVVASCATLSGCSNKSDTYTHTGSARPTDRRHSSSRPHPPAFRAARRSTLAQKMNMLGSTKFGRPDRRTQPSSADGDRLRGTVVGRGFCRALQSDLLELAQNGHG